MYKQSDISCKSCTSQLKKIRENVKQACHLMDFRVDRADAVVLAIDEACANVIRHSCNFSKNFKLKVESFEDNGVGVFVITDNAPSISESAIRPKDNSQLEPGGLGLHLIHQVMDTVELIPQQEVGNRLKLSLRIKA